MSMVDECTPASNGCYQKTTAVGQLGGFVKMGSEIYEHEGFSYGHDPEKPFELHQSNEKKGDTKQIRCGQCLETKLEVGQGLNFTIVRCPNCGHESCVHEG